MKLSMLIFSMTLMSATGFAAAQHGGQVNHESAKQEPCPFSKEAKARMFDNTNPQTASSQGSPQISSPAKVTK